MTTAKPHKNHKTHLYLPTCYDEFKSKHNPWQIHSFELSSEPKVDNGILKYSLEIVEENNGLLYTDNN